MPPKNDSRPQPRMEVIMTRTIGALLALLLGCQPANESAQQLQHIRHDDRNAPPGGVEPGPQVVHDRSSSCAVWRLLAATEHEIAAFRHPQGDPLESVGGPARAIAAGPGQLLLAASAEGVVVLPVVGEPFVLLDHPATAVAYDAQRDRLYAGLEGGVVVAVDDPAGAAPVGSFVAFAEVAALAVGVEGHLFAAEGGEVLRLAPNEPTAPLSSASWNAIEGLAIGVDGSLYLVDGGDTVFVVDNSELVEGPIAPTKHITVEAEGAGLSAVLVAPDGIGYVADHHAIHAIEELSDAYPFAAPTATWPDLAAPNALALLPPCPPSP